MVPEDDEKVVVETLTAYLNGVALEALVHGMYTSLVGVTLWYIFFNPTIRLSKGHTSRMSISVMLMYLFTTLNLGIRWSWMRSPLVFSRKDTQNGTAYYTFGNADDTTLWAISGAATGANILIADSILTWRCWVVWGRRWPIVVLPILLTVSGTANDVLFIYHNATDKYSLDGAIWGPAVKWGVIFYSMSLATTVYCTALIIFRILAHREQYWSVIEMVVESAVMYSLALVVFIGFLATDDVGGFYPKALLDTIAGIAPTLIVVRVVSGQGKFGGLSLVCRLCYGLLPVTYGRNGTSEALSPSPLGLSLCGLGLRLPSICTAALDRCRSKGGCLTAGRGLAIICWSHVKSCVWLPMTFRDILLFK